MVQTIGASALRVGRRVVRITNADKVLFPNDGITKMDLILYYARIAERMIPYLRARPLTMQRFPDGIDSEGFFQKEIPDYFPDWFHRVAVPKDDGYLTMPVVDDSAMLVYVANQACITPHVWLSRIDRPHHPDQMIFDLDPPDNFRVAVDAAKALRVLLQELGLTSYVKTTGSRGLHVVVPLDRSADFGVVRAFAHDVAEYLVKQAPSLLTTEQRKAERHGRLFLDTLRNSHGQTAVAPFAVRAKPGAPVAAPINWAELDDPGLRPDRYNVRNMFEAVQAGPDPWAGMHRHARSLQEPRRRLDALMGK